jgi:hypothetical protein
MTEEATTAVPAEAATKGKGRKGGPPANGDAAAGGDHGEKGKRKFNNKRDEKPIEELFDLSQPIPKVRLFFTVDACDAFHV